MNPPKTQKEAIFDMAERLIRVETVLTGVPNTDEKGLTGTVKQNCEKIEAVRKKIERLEGRFILLIGLLLGSGVLGGFGISQLIG